MANVILTPVTLWKDFDDSLPLLEEILSEREIDGGIVYREIYILGRKTKYGRVKIYCKYYVPKGLGTFPAVLLFFEAGHSCDEKLVRHFTDRGIAALCVDYCGDMGNGERHTIYPRDIDYGNFLRAGRAMDYADKTARETSWYEWAGVARYAARYLNEQPCVTATGAVGLRTGGEILWKIAPYAPVSCLVTICAAGWLAYRDMEKFGSGEKRSFDEERHRFIAGIDSQSYAPHVKCPVLILSAINDKKCNYDRVYDTFQQINPAVEKAILYSAHGNGLIGEHSVDNMDMFLDKFLKGRAVYISKPIGFSVFEEDGYLKVRAQYDDGGDPIECGIFYSEKIDGFRGRDWTRVMGNMREMKNNTITFPLDVYEESKKVLLYTFVRYSNGFSVTSKIQEVKLNGPYKNAKLLSRILFSGNDGPAGIARFRRRAASVADCFAVTRSEVSLRPGFGGIMGFSTEDGVISYRVSEPRFAPPEGACFQFDAYTAETGTLTVIFYTDAEELNGYSFEAKIEAGGKWKNFILQSVDFKSETGAPLADFRDAVSVVFLGDKGILANNLKWL